MNNSIEIKNLNKFYGKKQALYDVNLSIHQGMFGLLGRNGAGKTTLMKTLATLLQKKDGEITVCGVPIEKRQRDSQDYRVSASGVFHVPIHECSGSHGISGNPVRTQWSRTKRTNQRTTQKSESDRAPEQKVKALSGGMKRRLGIAQALLNNPKVLIVDEPTAGLDPEERVRFRNLLSEIAEDKIVILSTHIVGDIEATCEDIAIINEGRVIYNGTVDELLQAAEGRVFTMTASKRELPELKRQLSITSMHTQGNKVHIRFIADTLMQGAKACEPNMEDAYMLHLHSSGVREILGEIGGEW